MVLNSLLKIAPLHDSASLFQAKNHGDFRLDDLLTERPRKLLAGRPQDQVRFLLFLFQPSQLLHGRPIIQASGLHPVHSGLVRVPGRDLLSQLPGLGLDVLSGLLRIGEKFLPFPGLAGRPEAFRIDLRLGGIQGSSQKTENKAR